MNPIRPRPSLSRYYRPDSLGFRAGDAFKPAAGRRSVIADR